MDGKIIETCLICSEYMGPFKNDLYVCTGFSEKPLYQMFEHCLRMSLTNDLIETAGVCQNCFIKFNEIDEHQVIAERIQNELLVLFNASTPTITEAKFEIKEEEIFEEIEEDYAPVELQEVYINAPSSLLVDPNEEYLKIAEKEIQRHKRVPRKKNPDAGLIMVEVDGMKIYQCDICRKVCKDRYKLKSHKETHTTERNVCCNECGAMFKTLSCLYSHKKIHKDRVAHECDHCGMRYMQKTQLRKHMDAIHLMKRDYTCTICGKSYSRDTTLSKHMYVHMTEKSVVCSVCGFRTHTKPKMDRHMKSHTGERNYACEICGKKFLYSYNVIAHVKYVHNREKRPYDESKLTCQYCKKKFQKQWKLKEHLIEAHNIMDAMEDTKG